MRKQKKVPQQAKAESGTFALHNDQICRNKQSAVDDGKHSPHLPLLCFSAAVCL